MFSELNDPARQPLSTLRYHPSRDHRQDSRPEWSRFSFSVGLSLIPYNVPVYPGALCPPEALIKIRRAAPANADGPLRVT
jgi:hypothetical protein